MKVGDIYAARELVTERHRLDNEREYAKNGQAYVSIGGKHLSQDVTDAAKPAVVAVYDRCIASIDERLRALGVEVE